MLVVTPGLEVQDRVAAHFGDQFARWELEAALLVVDLDDRDFVGHLPLAVDLVEEGPRSLWNLLHGQGLRRRRLSLGGQRVCCRRLFGFALLRGNGVCCCRTLLVLVTHRSFLH